MVQELLGGQVVAKILEDSLVAYLDVAFLLQVVALVEDLGVVAHWEDTLLVVFPTLDEEVVHVDLVVVDL